MELEQAEVTNTAPAPEAPSNPTPEANPAPSGAEPAKPVSRREAITQALEKSEKAKASPTTAPAAPATNAAGRKIDPVTKRFIKADGTLGEIAPAAEVVAPTRKPMPKAWKQDYAPKWEGMDPDLANFVAELEEKREKDVLSGIEQYKQSAAYGNELRRVLTPYEQTLMQSGSIAQGVDQLMKISSFASRDPQGFIQWFAKERGLQLGPQAETPPEQQALQQALQPYLQEINALKGQLQQFTQSQTQTQQRQSLSTVNAFLQANPMSEELTQDFVAQISAVRQANPDLEDSKVLEKAYDVLSWANEGLRQKRLEKQEQERKAKEAQELAAKKAAAVSVKGAPSTSPAAQVDPRDRRAVIARQIDRASR
jgi:hypothetical protein